MVLSRSVLCLLAFVVVASAASDGMRLIALNETSHVWMSQEKIDELIFSGKWHNFMDITDFQTVKLGNRNRVLAYPDQPTQREIVTALIANISIDSMSRNLQTLSSFFTRYYTSATGLQAAEWIYSELIAIKGARDDISVNYFRHTFNQPSIVARIEGVHDGPTDIVILGSHLDSVGTSPTSQSPGADDDGSGTICNLETFRLIVESGLVFNRAVEFHYYAAEEAGLLGSQAVAASYSNNNIEVYAMLQLDMTMYAGTAPIAMSPITDYTDAALTSFIRILIDTYATIGWLDSRCGYGCSDHASWNRNGYPSAFTFETVFTKLNPNIHSARDTFASVNLQHGTEFVRVALAHLVELGNAPAA